MIIVPQPWNPYEPVEGHFGLMHPNGKVDFYGEDAPWNAWSWHRDCKVVVLYNGIWMECDRDGERIPPPGISSR